MSEELFCIICHHQEHSHKSDGSPIVHNQPTKGKDVTGMLCSGCCHVLAAKTQTIPWDYPQAFFEDIKKKTINGYTRKK